MKSEQLQSMLLQLLEPDIYKTTAQLAEEFRMEYPSCWKELETEGQTLYGNSCSSIQQPLTRIAQALLELPPESCLRYSRGRINFWSKRGGNSGCPL
jgi:hypothetical protein